MDTRTTYRDIIKQIVLDYAQLRASHGNIRLDPILDEIRDRYAIMQTGWDQGRRVRGNLLYVTLEDEKIYIEYDGIGYGIADDLVARGIPEYNIVLAYLPDAPTLADYPKMETLSETYSLREKSRAKAAVLPGA